MHVMAKIFSKTYRLQADSFPEVTTRFEGAVLDLVRSVRFQDRKLRPGPFLNALALWFVELPEAERLQIAKDAVARLEFLMSEGEDPRVVPPGAAVKAQRVDVEVAEDHGQLKPARKRKSG